MFKYTNKQKKCLRSWNKKYNPAYAALGIVTAAIAFGTQDEWPARFGIMVGGLVVTGIGSYALSTKACKV